MVDIIKNITTVNRTVMSGRAIKYIVIHYTGNATDKASSNANYFKTTNRGASAHYFVDKTSIYQVVEDKDAAWAVGKNYGSNNLFGTVTNKNSISIEMCSDNSKIADETFANTVELTKSLMAQYNIPASNVVTHYLVCSKRCPGWDGWLPNNTTLWDKFKAEISGSSSASTTPTSSANTTTVDVQPNNAVKYFNGLPSNVYSQHVHDMQWALNKDYNSKLSEDGYYGQKTEAALYNVKLSTSSCKSGKSYKYTNTVSWVQCRVGASIDGKYGSGTAQKVKEFQAANGLTADGVVGVNTMRAILNKVAW